MSRDEMESNESRDRWLNTEDVGDGGSESAESNDWRLNVDRVGDTVALDETESVRRRSGGEGGGRVKMGFFLELDGRLGSGSSSSSQSTILAPRPSWMCPKA